MKSFFTLIKKHPFVLGYCFIVFIFTCLGQTFFISWFNPYVMEEFGLSRTNLSIIYSSATFLSSFFLPYIGRKIDEGNLIKFSIVTTVFITLGFITLSIAPNAMVLFLAYFVIRAFGQMTLGLLASTTLAKKFGKHRGKATSVANLGRTLGESIFPLALVFLISQFSWSQAATFVGIGFSLIFIPVSLYFLKSMDMTPLYSESDLVLKNEEEEIRPFDKWKFYKTGPVPLILLANMLSPFVLTGVFFQQTSIAEMKGWSPIVMSAAFSIYGLIQTFTLIIGGSVVDKYSATRTIPFILIPLLLGLLVLKVFDDPMGAYFYMGLFGIGTGLTASVKNSFYAENFSLGHLGQIKSIDSSFLVKATAFAPIFFAFLLDEGISIADLVNMLMALVAFGIVFYGVGARFFLSKHRLTGKKS